jgi:hypothetical protein
VYPGATATSRKDRQWKTSFAASSMRFLDLTTIEGVAKDGVLHPLQQVFIDHDAFQCGNCTPGQICSAAGLIAEGKAKTADEIRENTRRWPGATALSSRGPRRRFRSWSRIQRNTHRPAGGVSAVLRNTKHVPPATRHTRKGKTTSLRATPLRKRNS